MNLSITPWVCSKTYFYETKTSFSIIEDVKNCIYYVLKGVMSDLWFTIISTKDYTKIREYSASRNVENQLQEFLLELKQKDLIEIDINDTKIINKYLVFSCKETSKNYEHFDITRFKFISKNNLLESLNLELTYKCNLNCRHCCNPKDCNQYEITFENAKKIIDEASDLGLREISLTGGECSISKDFLKIAKYAKEKFLKVLILTNGQELYNNPELFEEIVKLYPATLKISLYSMNPEIHDNITGVKGSHNKTLTVIKKLKERNINVTVTCMNLSYNVGEYKKVREFANSINARFIDDHLLLVNHKNNNLCSKIKEEDIEKIYLENFKNHQNRAIQAKDDRHVCSGGINRYSITPKMDIIPCVYFGYSLGNYKEISFADIRKNIIPEFRKKYIRKNLDECFKHEYCKFCILCPAYAWYDRDGDFMKKSEILCEDARAFYKVYQYYKSKEKQD